MEIEYRKIRSDEEEKVCQFISDVFNAFVAPGFSEEGIRTFLEGNVSARLHERLERGDLLLIAEERKQIVGVIEMRNGNHVSRFFVRGKYQRQGIGRGLLQRALQECRQINDGEMSITVNSSPNAVGAYERFAFRATDKEQVKNGIRYIPMKLEI